MSESPTVTEDDTSFVPQLDARQRAMLAEMGVRVWAPKPRPAAVAVDAGVAAPASPGAAPAPKEAPDAVAHRPAERAPTPVARPAAVPSPVPAQADAGGKRPAGIETMDWPTLQAAVAGCRACGLCQGRTNTVFGVGDTQADWMIVGEAPGENEDRQGEPFVGAAGQLLDNMLLAVGRSRTGEGEKGAYIANVLKCRPPANRNPQPAEVVQCEPYLARQVALVKPRVIVAMGRFAVQSLLKTTDPIGRLRGQVHRYEGVPVIVTYHPAYLLRTPTDKGKAWADLCLAMEQM
ncbi:DNA polymerase [Hydrogenophaga palleronii]|uniref:Type-4 uracil-DNA glycosylase n=1 Tax=Hydrogenophaga palleronii TaxID=65655 RepID=A0ABU1WRZ9_9BURK|nr:uracil-DNA glycosylase [Hydrogenophaga palleronii]MDR7151682.1 DNA polymerase [Hydrogenophaga palleronii]